MRSAMSYVESGYVAEYEDGSAVVMLPQNANVFHRSLACAWRWCLADGIKVRGVLRMIAGGWPRKRRAA